MNQAQKDKKLHIVWVYGDLLNLYGDRGNILTLIYRAKARGIPIKLSSVSLGQAVPASADLIFLGGGQDQEQALVSRDIQKKADFLREFVQKGGPLLSICGGYQLLGRYYQTGSGKKIDGAGVLPVYTKAGKDRMIGDIIIESNISGEPSKIIGFENHSGKTYLTDGRLLGQVVLGSGNNGEDGSAGCVYRNAIGTYLHGPVLPKNPQLADYLIFQAIKYNNSLKTDDLNRLSPLEGNLDRQLIPLARQEATDRAVHRKKSGLGLRS